MNKEQWIESKVVLSAVQTQCSSSLSMAIDDAKEELTKSADNPVVVFTFGIAIFAISILLCSPSAERSAQLGDFFAGFASALAFLWLVHGYRMQAKELGMQREELKLQRDAMDRQTVEFKKTTRLAALERVEALYRRAQTNIPSDIDPHGVTDYLIGAHARSTAFASSAIIGEDVPSVKADLKNYKELFSPVNGFFNAYRAAAIFYLENYIDIPVDKSDDKLLSKHNDDLNKAEYLSDVISTMIMLESNQELIIRNAESIEVLSITLTAIENGNLKVMTPILMAFKGRLLSKNYEVPLITTNTVEEGKRLFLETH